MTIHSPDILSDSPSWAHDLGAQSDVRSAAQMHDANTGTVAHGR